MISHVLVITGLLRNIDSRLSPVQKIKWLISEVTECYPHRDVRQLRRIPSCSLRGSLSGKRSFWSRHVWWDISGPEKSPWYKLWIMSNVSALFGLPWHKMLNVRSEKFAFTVVACALNSAMNLITYGLTWQWISDFPFPLLSCFLNETFAYKLLGFILSAVIIRGFSYCFS